MGRFPAHLHKLSGSPLRTTSPAGPEGKAGMHCYTGFHLPRSAGMATIELTRDNFEEVITGNDTVIVDF